MLNFIYLHALNTKSYNAIALTRVGAPAWSSYIICGIDAGAQYHGTGTLPLITAVYCKAYKIAPRLALLTSAWLPMSVFNEIE